MMMTRSSANPVLGLTAILAVGIPLAAQSFDNSGNATLKGDYFVRQVVLTNLDQNTSAVGRAISLTGTMTFDGNGNYTFSGQKMDTQAGSAQSYSTSGQYAVQPNGLAQIQNPIDGQDVVFGAVGAQGPAAIVASSTETTYRDIFVAIPAGTGDSNGSVQGSYRAGFIDFLGGNASQVRDGYFALTSNGAGSFGTLSVNGAMANQGSANTTQSLAGVTYSIGANGSGTVTFPTASSPGSALLSGQKILGVSKDGSILVAGSASGFDVIVAIQAGSGVSNNNYEGTYFVAALQNDAFDVSNGNNAVGCFSGSTLALGSAGTTISQRRLAFFNQNAYDYTADGSYDLDSSGAFQSDLFEDILGANGQAALQIGRSDFYLLTVGLRAADHVGTDVFIDPVKVWNAASFAPITNSVAPGEFVSLFGSRLSSMTLQAPSLPLNTNLGGVQVTANGRLAPLQYVSSNQINLIVPFGISDPYVTFQVSNNSVLSNKVTLYTNHTAPGVFALNSNGGSFPSGVGPSAVRHADFSVVTPDNPAKPGETMLLYVTGLGLVTPAIGDGVGAPTDGSLVTANADVGVEIQDLDGDFHKATVNFKGLAPGFTGLYQINFVVPDGVPSGLVWVNVGTPDAYTSEAKLYLKSPTAAAVPHKRQTAAHGRRFPIR